MQVALSVDALSPGLSGIGRYCLELVERVPTSPDVSRCAFFRGNVWIGQPQTLLTGLTNPVRAGGWRNRFDRWWNHDRFSRAVVHAPNYFLPDWAERGVATVHDLSVFKYPETHPVERIKAFEQGFRATVDRAALILTDCEWVRDEVLAFTGLPAHKVMAVPLGVSEAFRPHRPTELQASLSPVGLRPNGYGLCVSTLEPRKRIDRLVAAWRALPLGLRTRFPLVLAGGQGWCNDALLAEIEQGRAEGWLIPLGYVKEQDLPMLYAGARVFAYPSMYEGFGLPPLEAMASGVPAVASVGTCLEETVGAGGCLVDVEDTSAFAAVLAHLLQDDLEHARRVEAGLAWVARFNWPACIEQTIAAYRLVQE